MEVFTKHVPGRWTTEGAWRVIDPEVVRKHIPGYWTNNREGPTTDGVWRVTWHEQLVMTNITERICYTY